MTDEAGYTETDNADDVEEASDLLIGFIYHEDGGHWHPAAYSYPESFSDDEVDQLESLMDRMAEELTQAGLKIPADTTG